MAAVHLDEILQQAPRCWRFIRRAFFARLLQYVLLEIGPLAEDLLVRGGGRMLRVLDRRELHGADMHFDVLV